MKQTRTLILSILIIGIGSRLIPHYPNFTAVGAVTLFGAAFAGRKTIAIIIPFLVMLFSDMILNNLVYAVCILMIISISSFCTEVPYGAMPHLA